MANRNRPPTGQYRPPDLRGLAHRELIDPAEIPTDEANGLIEAWPAETAEVELLPTTTEADVAGIPAVPPLGPAPGRGAIPVLSSSQARAPVRTSSSRWVGNLVLVAVAMGLLGGISFAVGAVWFIEPTATERWFARVSEWMGAAPDDVTDEERSARLPVPSESEPFEPDDRVEEARLGDEVAFEEAPDAEIEIEEAEPVEVAVEPDPIVIEPDPGVVEPEPAPVVAPPPRPRRRARPRPLPRPKVVVPLPSPTVKPYTERPRPAPGASTEPAAKSEDGLFIER